MIGWLSIAIAILGAAVSLAAWGGCHWLAQRMERDDDKDRGIFRD